MDRNELIKQILLKKSFLCVGLDPDTQKIPKHLLENEEDPIYEFNKQIVDATAPYCVSFKPNTAFYEAYGLSGLHSLEKTIQYIKLNYPELNKYINMDSNKLTNFSDITTGYPKAMDKGHDGPDAQIVLADYIYKQLLKRHEKIIPIKDAKFLSLKDFPVSHKKLFEQTNQW